jgi:hypothetical protein
VDVGSLRRFLHLAASALVCACTQPKADEPSAPAPPPPAPSQFAQADAVFADCHIDCTFDFRALDAQRVRVTQGYCRDAEPRCITFEATLTPAGRERMRALGASLGAAQLASSYGCGACVDGYDHKLLLPYAGGAVSEHSYDATRLPPDLPKALVAAHPQLEQVRDAMSRCTSNELLAVDPQCTPRDKLSPPPFSRP